MRTVTITRNTKETQIELRLNLDGTGQYQIETPVGFLNHMLELFANHGLFDLTIKATGDMNYDDHHTIEDTGIVLGQAIAQAVGDKSGVKRYGSILLPMDEVLCAAVIDLAGRYAFATNYAPMRERVNDFPTEMMWHFFQQVAINAQINLHLQLLNPGNNEHHRLEAIFKGFARALRQACEADPRAADVIPSTKGTLSSKKKQ
jgi:imidazoleglycerol-phosphate dehydratase